MIQTITPQQANQLFSRGDIEIIDVREPTEWSGGHIAGARLVPLGDLRKSPKASLPRDGVIFVCAAGVRSATAARIAASCGLTTIYNLTGGTRAWVKDGFALTSELRAAV